MAEKISEKEDQLRKRARRRLVGAITLVIISVVVLPLVFDGKPQQKDHEIEVVVFPGNVKDKVTNPASEKSAPAGREASEAEIADPAAAGLSKDAPSSARATSTVPDGTAREAVTGVAESKSAGKSADAGAETGNAGNARAESFVVQLGAFTDPEKARQQYKHPALSGVRVYTEQSRTEKGEIMTRVRAGPFATRAEAELVKEKLKKANITGVIANK